MIKYSVAEENDLSAVCNVLRKSFPIYEQMGLNTNYLEKLSKIDTGIRNGASIMNEYSVSIVLMNRRQG